MIKEKVIVTGGEGFIGSHLVDRLIDMNYDVIVIDDESAESNETFYKNPNATYYNFSILELWNMDHRIFKDVKCIFHLAAESRIGPAIKNPIKAVNTNVVGTTILLELAKEFNIKKFIYSSTSSVYGLRFILPINENNTIDCLNTYSATKFAGEEMVRMYSKLYGLDTCIFRYFNVFGERSPTKGIYAPVVGLFLKAYRQGNTINVVGDGEQKRDFVHVKDVIEANILAFLHKNPINGQVFNIGYGKYNSINELANIFVENGIKKEYIPERIGEARHTLADISLASSVLNYKPKYNIIDWIKEQL